MNAPSAGRLPAVDGLRTFAVLAVFAVHADGRLLPGGYLGVDVFFVISGFVITGLLLREHEAGGGRFDLGRFYANRLWRLAPVLVCATAVLCALLPFTSHASDVEIAPYALTYTMDFFRIKNPARIEPVFLHTWSLAVEEQFYVVWPLVVHLALRGRGSVRRLSLVTAGAAAMSFCTAAWFTGVRSGAVAAVRIYNGPDTRAVQLLIGCLLACSVSRGVPHSAARAARAMTPLSLLGLGAWALLVPDWRNNPLLWITMPVIAVATASLLLTLATDPRHPATRTLALPVCFWPGRYLSYGVYLWHYPVVRLLQSELPDQAVVRTLVPLLVTLVLAYASFVLVERPTAARRQRSTRTRRPLSWSSSF